MTAIREVDPAAATARQADKVTSELEADIDEIVSHYPVSKRSASLPLLHYWQNHFGHVDDSGIEWIAARLDLQPINIYELVTFYPWFRREAAGRRSSGLPHAGVRIASYAVRGFVRLWDLTPPSITVRQRCRPRRMAGSAWSLSNVSPTATARRLR
jgi:hypothetical protein